MIIIIDHEMQLFYKERKKEEEGEKSDNSVFFRTWGPYLSVDKKIIIIVIIFR